MAATLTVAAKPKAGLGVDDNASPNVLDGSCADKTTAVSKSPPKNLTRSSPGGPSDQQNPRQYCGGCGCDGESTGLPDLRARTAGNHAVGISGSCLRDARQSLQTKVNTKEDVEDRDLIELNGDGSDDNGNNGEDDDDDEGNSGEELTGSGDIDGGGGGGRCKCVVCIGRDNRRSLRGVASDDGDENGSAMVVAAAEEVEMAQCALHGVFSPPTTCTEAWTLTTTTRKAKSSCFTVLCKTCAKQIFQRSPSPPASSSLCVHGRRRGGRNSTPTSSIRKEDVVSRATEVSVTKKPSVEGPNPGENIVSENPGRSGDVGRVGASAESASESVLGLGALTQLLAEKSRDHSFAREKSSDAKAIIEAINRILESRKSFVSCEQAACENSKRSGTAQNVLVKGPKSAVKDLDDVCAKNALRSAVNQSSGAENSNINEQSQLIGENAFFSGDSCTENTSNDVSKRKIESPDCSDCSSTDSDTPAEQFNANKVGNRLVSEQEDPAIRLSDGGCRPQPTSIQKDSSKGRVGADVAGAEAEQSNSESSFVASNRLKRLEEHFKGFAFTKKLPKDEPLVDVTDSDCSIYSLCRDVPHEFFTQKQLAEAFDEPPSSFSTRPEKGCPDGSTRFGSEALVDLELQKDCSPLVGRGSSSVNPSKLSICQNNTPSPRPDNEDNSHDKCGSASKNDSGCLQVPGKRQTSTAIHSSLSSTINPSQCVAPTDLSSQIDQKRPEIVRNDSIVLQRLHLNGDVESIEPNKDTLKQQCKQSERQQHRENHQHLQRTSTNLTPKRKCESTVETVEQQGLLPKKTKSSQDSQQKLSQHVAKTAECQFCVGGSDKNSQAKDEGECAQSSTHSSGKSQRNTREVPPPPLPPRLSPASGPSVSTNNSPFPAKHLCKNNNVYECPLAVISSRKHAVSADANGKNSFTNNNNISYSECALRHHNSSSSFNSLPAILHGLPPPDGGDVSCCEFDVRFIDDFENFSLTLECYDEFEVENCCENNYYHSGHDPLSCSPPSSGCSCSASCGSAIPQCSVIEAVPLFQYQRHQSHPREATHHNLHHHIHHCHVVPSGASTMRELNGPLRGLLKKPNRPASARKNRVVFDETRNEFFEADYIILIREDCAYDEEDEEPCTCGEHELVRLCCEEGCQCNYSEDSVTPQAHTNLQAHPTQKSPKYAPPIEFVDEAALSPPDGYKDNGLNALSGALSGHVFGAQHIQQLQVIQRLQQQRAAMLAARASNQQSVPNQQNHQTQQQQQKQQQQSQQQVASSPSDENSMAVCTECVECVECAAKQLQDEESVAVQCQEDIAQLGVPHVALVPLHNNSPERRITQKEIIAGEERPKYVAAVQLKEGEDEGKDKKQSVHKNQRYVVETITMTTVTERRIVHESTQDVTTIKTVGVSPVASAPAEAVTINKKPPIPAKPENIPAQISGILKGGKLWKNEMQAEESSHPTSDDDSNSKRSVRFTAESLRDAAKASGEVQLVEKPEEPINELIPLKKHSTLFHNVLRPNSAVRQLFPAGIHPSAPATTLTHETLKAFEESKRGGLVSNMLTVGPPDTDTIRRTIERNALRRKKAMKADMTLEERIKQLTCDIDEPTDSAADDESAVNVGPYSGEGMDRRDSPAGEENPSQPKYIPDKSFSPSSSASSSSSGSTSAYRKISDIFNRDRRQEKIPEAEENPIVIIPQECRCPAAPDLGMGVQVPAAHTQIHQTPPRQTEPRRQFLSTLAPLTACVAGQKDDFSYYTLAAGDRSSIASAQCSDYSLGDIESALSKDESRKVAPDVIAGTPGQEQDELVIFAQQEANRTDKIKKRYSNEHQIQAPMSNASSDDDEQNDYGFNKRPTVQGIKAKFETTNEIIEEMQAQLSHAIASQQSNNTSTYSTLKGKNSTGSNTNKAQQQAQPNNTMPQNPADRPAWGYYSEDQRTDLVPQQPNYYQALPANFKQTFHTHEESLMYQNCQSVSMRQHYGRFARSPSRRPESPPPLRNYHQTMVLIPYNTQSYAQFSTTDDQQAGAHQFRRQNVLEYQQVTQQTIRVPIGYTIPGMQLHLVAGRGAQQQQQQQQQHVQYSQNPRLVAPRTFNMAPGHDANSMKFAERGVPEGSASTSHTDCKGVMSPTSAQAGQNQCNQTSQVSPAVPGAVFYAMNV